MVKIYLYAKYVFYILVAISVMLALTLVYLLLSGSANIPEPTSPVGLAAIFIVGYLRAFIALECAVRFALPLQTIRKD